MFRVLRSIFNPRGVPAFLITLDALGTLYKLRQPVATQYRQIARECGLQAKIDLKELDAAFKSAFKHHSSAHPNYGKHTLENPAAWWDLVVAEAFGQVVAGGQSALPSSLGPALYKHFSSSAAYEPFPDVRPFLQSMAALKRRFTAIDGPIVLTGVVTNSDPRVADVLRDMGFRTGTTKIVTLGDVFGATQRSKHSPLLELYRIDNDFDLLATSYVAAAEKPDGGIWKYAERLANYCPLSRAEQSAVSGNNAYPLVDSSDYQIVQSKLKRIHVGDGYSKDYVGAVGSGWEALHLERGSEDSTHGSDVKAVKSLGEVAMAVNILANDYFDMVKR